MIALRTETASSQAEAEEVHERLTREGFIPTYPGSRDYTRPDGTEARVYVPTVIR